MGAIGGHEKKQEEGTMKARIGLFAVVMMAITSIAEAHGGGCRKSSPPGQCCHMDNRAGVPHCH